jgi:hypothetical protein
MRKVLSAVVLVAVTTGGYLVGVAPTVGHQGHTIQPDATARSITEGDAGQTPVEVTISVSPAPQPGSIPANGEVLAVDVGCQDGTAAQPADYACVPQTVTLTAADTVPASNRAEKKVTVAQVNGDTISEQHETFTVVLFIARCVRSSDIGQLCSVSDNPADVVVTITNDDQAPGTISIGDASAEEGNNGQTRDITFTVTLSRPCTVAQGNFTVGYATQSGTATQDVDYTGIADNLVFQPGQTTKTIIVKTIGDNAGESNETFMLILTPEAAAAGNCRSSFDIAEPPSKVKATGTITDDDGPPGTNVAATCSGNASGDFNGDGRDDLAVGIPGQAVNANGNAGAVQVLYGSLGIGLADAGKQVITQGANSVDGEAESGDEVGACLAAGNFNGDAFTDLAIGVPGEDITSTRGTFRDAGAVNVIYGSASGLNAAGALADQIWAQDSPGVLGGSEISDRFGSALAAGDFNGDGRDDLAIGVPNEAIGSKRNAGAVNVLPGSNNGLTATGDQIWHQDVKKVAGASESGDLFGAALATGDLDGNGRVDLVVGVPGEAIGSIANAGAIQVFRAGNGGLNRTLDKIWFQGNNSVQDTAEANDRFGSAVAVGDFDNDGFADIAAGVPGEDLGTRPDVGAVAVLYSTNSGPSATDNELWSEADSTKSTGDTPNAGDAFGAALTSGDFNGNGFDDLAIGVPGNDFAGTNAGSVDVLYGLEAGLGTPQHFTQGNLAASDGAQPEDAFGSALTSGDYNGDNRDELAIGVPKEDIGTAADAGAVNVLFGSATALLTNGDQFITQDTGTVQASGSQSGDQYGASVS